MTISEYYGFPPDVNAQLNYSSFHDMQDSSFPCAEMNEAFTNQSRTCVKLFDTSKTTSMANMLKGCRNLYSVPLFETSNVTDMSNMLSGCSSLVYISELNTSNVTNMSGFARDCGSLTTFPHVDTRNVTDMSYMCSDCSHLKSFPQLDTSSVTNMKSMLFFTNLDSFPQLDTSKVTDMTSMIYWCPNLTSLPPLDCSSISGSNKYPVYEVVNLIDVGGFINMKYSWTNAYGLVKCDKLSYQSCINILNGLYDFTGNGERPTSSQGKLKVHANFLALVGDELSIGTDKGWTITA